MLLSFSKAYKSKTAAAESYSAIVVLDREVSFFALLFVLTRNYVFLLPAKCGKDGEAGINAIHDFVVNTHFCIAIVFIAKT